MIIFSAMAEPIDSMFPGDLPSLVLPRAASRGGKPGPKRARAGLLDERSAREAAASLALLMPAASGKRLILEGLSLLWNDHWDPAHEIAQSSEGEPDHDLLHAILHRREGDFANSGYWFRGAGKHACYPGLERRLASLGPDALRAAGLETGKWSPTAFLAAVRANEGKAGNAGGGNEAALMRIQAEEFRAFAAFLLEN